MTEGAFFALIGVAVAVFLFGGIAYRVLKKHSIPLSFSEQPNLKEIATWVQQDSDVKKRFIVTLGVLSLVGVGSFIPIPGVNVRAVLDVFRELSYSLGEERLSIMSMLDMVTGGAMSTMTVFSLGLVPFFSACILLQIASAVIPSLKRHVFGGESGRKQLAEHTYPLTILLSLISAYFASFTIEKSVGGLYQVEILTMHGWPFRLLTMATLTGGVVLLLFLANLITRRGIGNGVAVIAVASFPVTLFLAVRDLVTVAQDEGLPIHGVPLLVILAVLFVSLAVAIYVVTNWVLAITLRGAHGGQAAVPLRPSLVGEMPKTLAVSAVYLPIYLASFSRTQWAEAFSRSSVAFNVIYAVLILTFTYLYALLVFKPRYFIDLVQKYGYTVSKTDGDTTTSYLRSQFFKLLVVTGLFLTGIAILPDLVMAFLRVPPRVASVIGGAELLVVVGVLSDVLRQLTFLKEKRASGLGNLDVCYTAFDEIEATIKADHLRQCGIPALIEPLRYTWGMPIRTIVDQYRIYTPANKRDEARSLIA